MKNTNVESLFRKLSNSIPKAETELLYRNTFELLIAVILSAQATDISVNKVTPKLFAAFPTPEKMYEAGVKKEDLNINLAEGTKKTGKNEPMYTL